MRRAVLEEFERGNVLLLIGEGVNQGILPSSQDLARELAEHCDCPSEERSLSLARVASYYEMTTDDRHGLIRFLNKRLSSDIVSEVHLLLAQLDVEMMVTTCMDDLLKCALVEAQVEHISVVYNSQLAYRDEERLLLVNLCGVLNEGDSLIITEDDQRGLWAQRATLWHLLASELVQRTLLLIGFDASSQWFFDFYDRVTRQLDQHRRPTYILGSDLGDYNRVWWEKRNAEILDIQITDFLVELTQELADRKPKTRALTLPELSSPKNLPERPYKFLDYYEAKDAHIFYGREQEIQHLCALIHAHRLVILYGISGVGKTSLLMAGAVPRLEQAASPYKAIYVRALQDPSLVIRETLRRQLPGAELPKDGSLVDFLAAVTHILQKTLIIVLDQFEEFFIRLSPEFRAAFIKELGDVYDARDVPVKILFSLREDWLASMDEIEQRIPDLLRTRMRVSCLIRQQAEQAITGPVKQLGISYDATLLEQLLEDLLGSQQRVMPPQLQLVCNALYEARPKNEQVITLETYEHLGGTKGLLRNYLEQELDRLEPTQEALAYAILEELVTSEETKAVKNYGELALGLNIEEETLKTVLKRLVEARLLRVVKDKKGQDNYEMAHEYLIDEIRLTSDTRARKRAEELLQQEVSNWQRFGSVLAPDKLAFISKQRDLLRIDDDAQALLLHSALNVGQDVGYWLQRVNDVTRRVELLSEASRSQRAVVRQRAVMALGSQDVLPAVEPLLSAALHDSNRAVRDAACQSLARLTTQYPAIVKRLVSEVVVNDPEMRTRFTRTAVLRVLSYLPLSGLSLSLRTQVLMMRIYLYGTSLLQASWTTPERRAIAMTTGLLGLFVALAHLFSLNSYYLATEPSQIPGNENQIVIRRGHPGLKLLGLQETVVDSGISFSQVANDHKNDVDSEQLWGISSQTTEGNFEMWGQDLAERLKLEDRLPMRWYLGQKEQAWQAILRRIRSPDTQLYLRAVRLLEEVIEVDPQLVIEPELIGALLSRLKESDSHVRQSAVSAMGQVVAANPELATKEVVAALLQALSDEKSYVRDNAVFAVAQVAEANPQLVTKELIAALLQGLSDEDKNVRKSAASAVAQVAQANSQLVTEPFVAALLPRLLSDEAGDGAVSVVAQVAQANPQLVTKELIAALEPKLSEQSTSLRLDTASALAQVVEANPQLVEQLIEAVAQVAGQTIYVLFYSNLPDTVALLGEANPQQVMAALTPLLKGNVDYVRANAAYAVGEVLQANPDPQLAKEVISKLQPLLEDEQWLVRYGALFAVGQVGEVDSQQAGQVIEALLPLLSDKNSGIRGPAAFVLAQVIRANPQLAEQLIDPLLPLLSDKNSEVRANAAFAVEQVGKASPHLAEEALRSRLQDEDKNVRNSAVSAVARAYAHQKDESFLFDKLTDPQDALERPVAARALFLITLQDPIGGQPIYGRLEELAKSREPMERIWANKTLAMLSLATEAHEAELDEEKLEETAHRLQKLCQWHDNDRRCSMTSFFGEDFTWAAGEAFNWLEEQKKGAEGRITTQKRQSENVTKRRVYLSIER